jgi:TatD DNase family protein
MPKLIDVHAHVHFAAYEDDAREVIDRALSDNIWMVTVGTQRETSEGAIKIAEEYKEGLYATVGLHPIHTSKSYHDEKELGGGDAAKAFTSKGEDFDPHIYKGLANHEKVVAIGECGLDYYRLDEKTKEKQAKVFEEHIMIAGAVGKPLMIHCRDAFADLIEILKVNKRKLKTDYPGIVHFFTGSVDDAKELAELGFYFSFGGVVTFTRDYDESIKEAGIERIVLETDAPYVAPVPFRGKRNEPAYILHTAEKIAEILGKSTEEVQGKTTENARKILGI